MTADRYRAQAMGLRAAEESAPGFVYRNGWTHLSCPACGEVIYDGRQISAEDTEKLLLAHSIACSGGTP